MELRKCKSLEKKSSFNICSIMYTTGMACRYPLINRKFR